MLHLAKEATSWRTRARRPTPWPAFVGASFYNSPAEAEAFAGQVAADRLRVDELVASVL